MQLYLVRHGQTPSNVAGALDTAYPGAELNQTGRAQAEELVRRWLKAGYPRPDAIYTSDIVRVIQTATPLAQHFGLDLTPTADLREVQAGELEMRSDTEAVITYLETVAQWLDGNTAAALPGAEDGAAVIARYKRAVASLAAEVGPEGVGVLFAHGALIRIIACLETPQVTTAMIAQHPVPNASITILEGEPGAWNAKVWASRPVDEWPVSDEVGPIRSSRELLIEHLRSADTKE